MAHDKWHHDISFQLLKDEIQNDDTCQRPHAHFWAHENSHKTKDKSDNRASVWDKLHGTSDEGKRKYIFYWYPYKLTDIEADEIDGKHKCCEDELSSEPCMDSMSDSVLSPMEIPTEIRWEYTKGPPEEGFSLEDNKKCQQKKDRYIRQRRGDTRGERKSKV